MIVDSQELPPGHSLQTDVAVIGAGAAGITLARQLTRKGNDVVLLEAGGWKYEQEVQALYTGEAVGPCLDADSHYLTSSRLRYMGGTTNHWNGWCRPLDPLDFERREWLDHSGWPLTAADLQPYYGRAAPILHLDEFGRTPEGFGDWALFTRSDIVVKTVYDFSPPVRFRSRFRGELHESERVRVLLYANVLGLELATEGRRVASLRVASAPGRQFEVRARLFVLASGGVENARLLLASDGVQPGGIGNERDLVGRFFMEHPGRVAGMVVLTYPPEELGIYRRRRREGQKRMVVLALSDEYRRKNELLNAVMVLYPRDIGQVAGIPPAVAESMGAIDRLREPERPGTMVSDLVVGSEQAPNPESRVTLDTEIDPFGVRRVRLEWRLQRRDFESMYRTVELLAGELGRSGIGRVQLVADPEDPWSGANAVNHHMGTTRMASTPETGVVDADCRVFGTENLYVAGSSVFPTVGYAGPTFTIVALALRLGDHLEGRLKHG